MKTRQGCLYDQHEISGKDLVFGEVRKGEIKLKYDDL